MGGVREQGGDPASRDPERVAGADEVDEQFRALMEGLRTTIPGVMVLFAFLLTVPFAAGGFGEFQQGERVAFYVAFAGAALAAVLLIAPSVHQRVRAPFSGIKRRNMEHVMTALRVTIAGTLAFLISVAAVVYLVTSRVAGTGGLPWAILATAGILALSAWAWFFLPLVSFNRD